MTGIMTPAMTEIVEAVILTEEVENTTRHLKVTAAAVAQPRLIMSIRSTTAQQEQEESPRSRSRQDLESPNFGWKT